MADSDQVLKVGAEFDVSPLIAGTQQAVTAFNNLGTAVQQQAAKFKAAGLSDAETVSVLQNLGYAAKESATAVASLGGTSDETASQITVLQTQVNELTGALERATSASRGTSAGVSGINVAARETRITTDLLTGNVSRAEQAMVRLGASSGIVGGLLSTAFPVFAAIALIDVLKSMSEAYDKLINSLAGWDAEAQRAYDQIIAQNRKLYISTVETANEINNLNLVGKDGMEKFALAAKDNAENVKAIGEATAVLMRQLAAENDQLAVMQSWDNKIVEALGLGSQEFEDKVKRLQKEIADTTSEIDALVAKQRSLQTVEPKKNTAEEAAEAIRLSREMREAKIEDEKAVATAQQQAQRQSVEQLKAEGQITADQEAALLKNIEADSLATEEKYYEDRIALVRSEGSAHLAEVQRMGAEELAAEINIDAKKREIDAKAGEEDRKAYQQVAKGLQEDFLRALDEKAKALEEEQKQELADELEGYKAQIEIARSGAATIAEANRAMYDERREDIEKYREVAIAEAEEEYQKVVQIYEQEAATLREKARKGVITEEEASKQIKAIYADEARAYQQMALQIEKTNQQMYQKIQTEAQQTWKKTTQELNSAFNQWITGQQTFGAAMAKFWDQLVLKAADSIASIGENWILGLVLQQSAQEKQVLMDAKTAAANAYASAPNPIIGAVEAAATFTAIVAAYTPTFEHGGIVPGSAGAPVGAIVHAGERVLTPGQNTNFERIANSTTNNKAGNVIHSHTTININHQGTNMTDKDISRSVREALRKGQLQGLDV